VRCVACAAPFACTRRGHAGTAYDAEVPFAAWYNTRAFGALPAGGMLYHEFVRGCGAPGVLQEVGGAVTAVLGLG
jgi:hypothetical protein